MTMPDADRPTAAPQRESWWTPLTRIVVLVVATVLLAGLAGNITVTVELTGAWSARCTVDLAVAAVYAAVLVRAANRPAGKARGR